MITRSNHNRAIFLDKDGTVIRNVPHNTDVSHIYFLPGVKEGLSRLANSGYKLFIVSNQAGIANGLFNERQLHRVKNYFQDSFRSVGARLAGFYYCPHDKNGAVKKYAVDCECRKPKPGMIMEAAKKHGINLSDSWMIGDILDDIESGHQAGCKTIFINNGNETEWVISRRRLPDFVVKSFSEAVDKIIRRR